MAKRKSRAVVKGRSILSLDVLGEVRRAQRILRRVERYLHQDEQRVKRRAEQRAERNHLIDEKDAEFLRSAGDLEGQA